MAHHAFRKEYLKRWIAYWTLCCVVLTSQPFKLNAEPCPDVTCPCVFIEQDDGKRTRTATIVAGATIIALVAGVAFACGSRSHKGHCHSSSSRSSSSYSPTYSYDSYYNYSGDSYGHHHHDHDRHDHDRHDHNHHDHGHNHHDHGHNHHHHNHRNHHHHHRYSDYHNHTHGINYHSASDPQVWERDVEGNQPARCRQLCRVKNAKESDQISGIFVTHPSLATSVKGSVTAFVQMPDGTTQVLGSLPFSASAGSSLSYGPFTQKGSYLFGIRIDAGTTLFSQTKVGSVEINVNGSTVESRDFCAPAHSPSHYEPSPCEYTL